MDNRGKLKKRGKKIDPKKVLFSNKKDSKSELEAKEINSLLLAYDKMPDSSDIKSFQDFPLSKKTRNGLKIAEFRTPTDIQRESIGVALRGLDVLGASKTGGGKTLAFVIPILEKLFIDKWSQMDGLGALIITPTRELAYQIFEVIKKVGKFHDFSAGLIIGGKDLKFEKKRMNQVSIIICTPGRLLQHMDENPLFDCNNLKILVLDEADRCLDMGFQREMNSIIENLPSERQTLLFSATQTRSVKDLARLSLKSAVYVSVHENSEFSTPESLQQSYVVCPLESKLDMLWSFIKHHRKSKILVFLSSCKQVRFINLLFCRMRPGISVLALYGSLHQLKRMAVYEDFCKKQHAVMLATDIAARGLDFPRVDWVVQLDCPEDANTYIHRVGRTARYNSNGESLLVLLPSEENGMLEALKPKRIPIEEIIVNATKIMSVRRKFEALLARDINLKECAQRAFKAYLKSVALMRNKSIFDVSKLDLPSFARSLGLAVAPRVRYIEKRLDGNADHVVTEKEAEENINSCDSKPHLQTFNFSLGDDNEEDDLFVGCKKDSIPSSLPSPDVLTAHEILLPDAIKEQAIGPSKSKKSKSKAKAAKKLLKKNIQVNKKIEFDDEGEVIPDVRKDKQSNAAREYEKEIASGIDIEKAKKILKEEDTYDRKLYREKIKAKHREKKLKEKMARKDEQNQLERMESVQGGESDSDEEEGPDLSWLPDPDQIYNECSDMSNMSESSTGNKMSSSWDMKGRKRKHRIQVVNTDDESSDEDNDFVETGVRSTRKGKNSKFIREDLTAKDALEDFALKLLKS